MRGISKLLFIQLTDSLTWSSEHLFINGLFSLGCQQPVPVFRLIQRKKRDTSLSNPRKLATARNLLFLFIFCVKLAKMHLFSSVLVYQKKIPNHIVMKSILVHLFCYVSTNRQFLVNVVLFWIMFVFQKKIHTYIIYKNVCTLVGTAVYSGQPQAALGRGPSDRTRCGRLCMF